MMRQATVTITTVVGSAPNPGLIQLSEEHTATIEGPRTNKPNKPNQTPNKQLVTRTNTEGGK